GLSPGALQPENAVLNAKSARDPALQRRVTVAADGRSTRFAGTRTADGSSAQTTPAETGPGTAGYRQPTAISKISSADVLEALHHATGMPIVADFYTRLHGPDALSARDQPLFDTLNQLADALRLRWNHEDGWLRFRSSSFYNDRLKEVPN